MSDQRQPPMIRVGHLPATAEDLQALADAGYDGPQPSTRREAHVKLIEAKIARQAAASEPELQDRPGNEGSGQAQRLAGADEDPAGALQSGPSAPAPLLSARERVAALRARRGDFVAQPPMIDGVQTQPGDTVRFPPDAEPQPGDGIYVWQPPTEPPA